MNRSDEVYKEQCGTVLHNICPEVAINKWITENQDRKIISVSVFNYKQTKMLSYPTGSVAIIHGDKTNFQGGKKCK